MGLDITVRKLMKKKSEDYFTFLGKKEFTDKTQTVECFVEHGFKDYLKNKKQTYYDFKEYFKQHDMNPDDYVLVETEYSDKTIFTFQNKPEDLKSVWEHVQEKFKEMFPDEKMSVVNFDFEDTSIDFLSDEDKKILKKYGFKRQVYRRCPKCVREHITPMKYDIYPLYDFIEFYGRIEILGDDIPTFNKIGNIIHTKEVGYQRKGLNSKFYEDYREGKIGYFVFTKSELEKYKEEYCDEDHDVTYTDSETGEEKFLYHATPKVDFQHNIIDNFVEGECVVSFDW